MVLHGVGVQFSQWRYDIIRPAHIGAKSCDEKLTPQLFLCVSPGLIDEKLHEKLSWSDLNFSMKS